MDQMTLICAKLMTLTSTDPKINPQPHTLTPTPLLLKETFHPTTSHLELISANVLEFPAALGPQWAFCRSNILAVGDKQFCQTIMCCEDTEHTEVRKCPHDYTGCVVMSYIPLQNIRTKKDQTGSSLLLEASHTFLVGLTVVPEHNSFPSDVGDGNENRSEHQKLKSPLSSFSHKIIWVHFLPPQQVLEELK
ncbi:hypothetical protein STEG23_013917, partial [Scotinomys teguina]